MTDFDSSRDSVSAWIDGLRQGRQTAAAEVWNRFYARLVTLAYERLKGRARRAADEEDVVASAMYSFFQRVQEGRFPTLQDQDDLWHLLVHFTEYKILDHLRREGRQKRGGAQVRGESIFAMTTDSSVQVGIDQIAGREPTPEFAAAMIDEFKHLLGMLDDPLRRIAVLKFEGQTNDDIAIAIGRSLPTVERRLKLIREKWKAALPASIE